MSGREGKEGDDLWFSFVGRNQAAAAAAAATTAAATAAAAAAAACLSMKCGAVQSVSGQIHEEPT